MPYRVEIAAPPADTFDILVRWGALDVEPVGDGLAAIIPDDVAPSLITRAFGAAGVTFSAAEARDDGSVWLLVPRPVRIGDLVIAPPHAAAPAGALLLSDSKAFGTGHHPTTALCVEALEETLTTERPARILDVGTGSGILALAALKLGVPQAVGLDIDAAALEAAAGNARLNHFEDRLRLVLGGPEVVDGGWPLVVANVLAAPLIEMAPALVRRLSGRGRLILSGMPWSLEAEVRQAYQHLGIRHIRSTMRSGWTALMAEASW